MEIIYELKYTFCIDWEIKWHESWTDDSCDISDSEGDSHFHHIFVISPFWLTVSPQSQEDYLHIFKCVPFWLLVVAVSGKVERS